MRDITVALAVVFGSLWGLVWLCYHGPDAEWAKTAHQLSMVLLSMLWMALTAVSAIEVAERNL